MNLNQITKLTNDKLIDEYKNIKEKFIHSEPSNKEIQILYELILQEIRKRTLKTYNI